MTASRHTYTAVLQGTPDTPLDLNKNNPGKISLNARRSPHVLASLQLVNVDAALLELLDTRQDPIPRVTITVAATFPADTQSRTFDLCVRGWGRDQETGHPTLELASDEALLDDLKSFFDRLGAYDFQTSLRDVVNFALDVALPGTALEATPAVDADVSVYSDAENLCANPCANASGTGLAGWTKYGLGTLSQDSLETWVENNAGTAFLIAGPASGTGGYIDYVWSDAASLFGGKKIRFRANVRATAVTGATADQGSMFVYYSMGGPSFTGTDDSGALTAGTVRQRRLTVTFPERVDTVILRLHHGFTSTTSVRWSDVRVSEATADPSDWAYFDGDTPDTDQYEYDWEEDIHDSISRRTALVGSVPESLFWRAGQSVIDFLRPVVQKAGMRLVCDENRQWTLRDADYQAAGLTEIAYADNLIGGSESINRDDDEWCDGAVVRYRWTTDGESFERVDIYPDSGIASRVRYIERDTPWPGPGFAQYVVERAQNLGRRVTATTVANWDTTTDQPATFIFNDSPDLEGRIESVDYDLGTDEMTVESRTAELP